MDLSDGLDPAQLAAVTNPTDPVCVLARAGTGKTRVLTRRIAWRAHHGTLDVRRVAAITFTTRAATELRERLGSLLGRDTGTIGTFHALAWRMLRDHHSDRGSTPPVVADDPMRLLLESVPDRHRGAARAIAAEIAWAAARRITPETYGDAVRTHRRSVPVTPDIVADVFAAYTTRKRRNRVVDFDDLLVESIRLLETDTGFAQARRWSYRHFFVDEYQDVNPLQHRLLELWLADREDLFVVGDPDQAIYGFNGADASYLSGFTERHPNATVISLHENHRSTAGVVRVANSVLTPDRPAPVTTGTSACTVTACDDDNDEAVTIARALRSEHRPGRRWTSQVVLVRTHAQALPITDVLARAGIPVATPDRHPDRDAVRVLTFHAAKGLEWPVVHIAGLEEGFVPDRHARAAAEIAEERHLLYVALSRATRQVHITWAKRRHFGERIAARTPSRWLGSIEASIVETPRSPTPVSRSSDTVHDRSVVEPPADTARDRLLAWRSATARAAAVPVAVVIEDSVLDALVRLAPTDHAALGLVPGLGTIKGRRYGEDILAALQPETTAEPTPERTS